MTMPGDRWALIKSVVAGAVDRPVEERAAYVAGACGGQADVLREVESLLAAHRQAGAFLETPARVSAFGLASPDLTGRAIGSWRAMRSSIAWSR
jgi:hypothetical protein